MRRISLLAAIALSAAATLGAQTGPVGNGLEVRTFVGAFVPTGAQSTDFGTAAMLGAQVAHEFNDNIHLLGSVGWASAHNTFSGFSSNRTYIWQYDVGLEFNLIRPINDEWLFRPLVGIGAGGRTYDYVASGIGSNTCSAGYGAVGSEFQRKFVAIRLEARDYVSCFKSPLTASNSTRNDLGFSLGLAYHIR